MLEHGVDGVEQLDGDHDERLLGLFALRPLAQVDRAPLGTTVEDDHPIAGADQGRLEILPEVAGGLKADQALRRRRPPGLQGLEQRGEPVLGGRGREALADGFALAIEDGNSVVAQSDIDADEALRHGTPFVGCGGTARISRTGATHRGARMAWSIVRDGGEPSPSILDQCSRPGGRGATISLDGYLLGPEGSMPQPSSPSCLRTDLNRTLLLATRGIATTVAGASRS